MDSPRTPGRLPTRAMQRRSSVQSSEGTIHEEDTESEASEMAEPTPQSHRKNLTGKTIDPIQLLDKKDFQGKKHSTCYINFIGIYMHITLGTHVK